MIGNYSVIQWFAPVGLILGGLLIGLFVDRIALGRLRKLVARTRWNGNEIVINALRGMPLLWSTLLGVYAALQSAPLSVSWRNFAQRTLLVIAILSVTVFAANVAAKLVGLYARRIEGALPTTSLFVNLTKLFVFLIGSLIILQTLNISITPILRLIEQGFVTGLRIDHVDGLFDPVQYLDAINKAGGEQCGLIRQIIRNTSAIRRARLTISTNSNDVTTQIASISEQITDANERLERLSEQFAALKKLIEDVPKQPTFAQITPGDPEQLFAMAYSDYSRGNDALALSEFRQYIGIYPDSELADNAEYWIGEILYAQQKYQDAADEFGRVFDISPKGDKAAIALYKRAMALAEIGLRDEAVAQLNALIKAYPKRPESEMAKKRLQEWLQTQPTDP